MPIPYFTNSVQILPKKKYSVQMSEILELPKTYALGFVTNMEFEAN